MGLAATVALAAVLFGSTHAASARGESAPTADPAAKWSAQPIDPKYETDFTAYTIPRKDFRVSLLNLDYGLLDNLQVGTAPYMFLFGLANIHGKVTAIQTKKVDVSIAGGANYLDATRYSPKFDELYLTAYPLTLTLSWMIGEKWSLHVGQRWDNFHVEGAFDYSTLAAMLAGATGVPLGEDLAAGLSDKGAVYGGAQISVKQFQLGADWRLNHRDSLIFLVRSYTNLEGRIDAGVQNAAGTMAVGPAMKIDQPLTKLIDGTTSISWQFTWPKFRLRVGLPLMGKKSMVSGWVQPFELYWLL